MTQFRRSSETVSKLTALSITSVSIVYQAMAAVSIDVHKTVLR